MLNVRFENSFHTINSIWKMNIQSKLTNFILIIYMNFAPNMSIFR